jgi:hypothetical protein
LDKVSIVNPCGTDALTKPGAGEFGFIWKVCHGGSRYVTFLVCLHGPICPISTPAGGPICPGWHPARLRRHPRFVGCPVTGAMVSHTAGAALRCPQNGRSGLVVGLGPNSPSPREQPRSGRALADDGPISCYAPGAQVKGFICLTVQPKIRSLLRFAPAQQLLGRAAQPRRRAGLGPYSGEEPANRRQIRNASSARRRTFTKPKTPAGLSVYKVHS